MSSHLRFSVEEIEDEDVDVTNKRLVYSRKGISKKSLCPRLQDIIAVFDCFEDDNGKDVDVCKGS